MISFNKITSSNRCGHSGTALDGGIVHQITIETTNSTVNADLCEDCIDSLGKIVEEYCTQQG